MRSRHKSTPKDHDDTILQMFLPVYGETYQLHAKPKEREEEIGEKVCKAYPDSRSRNPVAIGLESSRRNQAPDQNMWTSDIDQPVMA
ncbi:coiled-coil domain-containing protein 179 isoform X3 [Rattus norvegicus]|uniref:coiled-coil domain-containing protein 179 isoform X3 n=1 Tax=Rattus norvegicus TaxID=10116 RepID=UPI0008101911|eukprot:XP_017445049.1 PREDICTED: coiled-coil domain-containing protein 179 isoform X1 [Rattus norvegicus]